LRLTGCAVAPRNGNHGPCETANDGLEWQFHGQVELRRTQRATSINDFAPIGLERVGRVIELDAEHESEKCIREAIEQQLDSRVIDRGAALDETASKHTVPPRVESLPVAHDIA